MEGVMEEREEEAVIRRVGVLSVANISGLVNFFMGLIIGIIITIFSLFADPLVSSFIPSAFYALILIPIGYGVFGWIGGIIVAALYNLSAKIARGIKLYS